MQIKPIPAFILFVGSYFPLTIILLLQDISESSWQSPICQPSNLSTCTLPILSNPYRSISLFALCLLSLILFITFLGSLRGKHTIEVLESKPVPNDLINYVFPYVVSFMGLDLGSDGKFYGFILFVLWMFLITYRSGQILMNPLILAAGWQLYEISARVEQHIRNVRALARSTIGPGDKLKSCVVQGIYVLSNEVEEAK